MKSKKICERIHVKKRAFERFGISLKTRDIKEIVRNIQNQKYEFISRDSHRVTKWRVPLGGTDVVAVYDRNTKTIVTVMPLEYEIENILNEVAQGLDHLRGNGSDVRFLESLDKQLALAQKILANDSPDSAHAL